MPRRSLGSLAAGLVMDLAVRALRSAWHGRTCGCGSPAGAGCRGWRSAGVGSSTPGGAADVLRLCAAPGPHPTQGTRCFVTQGPEDPGKCWAWGCIFSPGRRDVSSKVARVPGGFAAGSEGGRLGPMRWVCLEDGLPVFGYRAAAAGSSEQDLANRVGFCLIKGEQGI